MIQRKINTEFQSQRSLYFAYLIEEVHGRYAQNISDWTECTSLDDSRYLACSSKWIQEDADLCCTVVYRDEFDRQITSTTGFNISETYYITRMDIVERRLIQAGVRLAAVINTIVHPDDTPSGTLRLLSSPLTAFILIYIGLLS